MEGSTLAIVSEMYVQSSDTRAMTTADHPTKIWELHAEDVFSKVFKACLQELLNHINNPHPQTQFTKEEEDNSTLLGIPHYLDPTKSQQNHLSKIL